MQVIFKILIILILSLNVEAQVCKSTKWPFSKNIRNLKVEQMQLLPREHLYQYLYHEISSDPKKRVQGLASKLFFYLKNTEVNEDKYSMISALEWAADLDTPRQRIISLNEICSIENKIRK